MRNAVCQSLLRHAGDPNFVFLTGDLGFQALEPLQAAAGERFVNAGIAEQNMVSVAAGLASGGLRPWVYSIAPFVYARPYEQIRNDVCMHDLPVKLVGNGGGYAYGVMGGTHHALGDYGALLCLDNLRAFVPAFAADIAPVIDLLADFEHPAYLRLGRCELPAGCAAPPYAAWRQVTSGNGPAMVAVGPLAGSVWGTVKDLDPSRRPNLWVLAELPVRPETVPDALLAQLQSSGRLIVLEEHVAQGGAGQMLAHTLALRGQSPRDFQHRCAQGYPSGRYGSQKFHRQECGLDPAGILREFFRVTAEPLPKIEQLQGPILVLGASGFVGANLLKMLLRQRSDVFGTASNLPSWRLEDVPEANVRAVDLLVDANLDSLLESIKPRTIFNCVAYGGYSFESDAELIYKTNFNLTARLLERLQSRRIAAYVHAGSSSEYGLRASGPAEGELPEPNSDYAVSKAACTSLFRYYGRVKCFPCVNLRLYSVYGPLEDASRLIPTLVRKGTEHCLPEFVDPEISRDFVYIDDVCEAFIAAALNLPEEFYGESFNIGSGRKTTIGEVAEIARSMFHIAEPPVFSMSNRKWDVSDWYANIDKAQRLLHWRPRTTFEAGLQATAAWYEGLENKQRYQRASKQFGLDTKFSVAAIVACYKDGQAIPIMYRRLKAVFEKLGVEYEIIFVNDNSPDESEEVIRGITRNDRRVLGISHSRNFGSQAAFRSGMELATKNACVLLDGDLQDPPELIEDFVARWREGYDVVYGRRVKRVAPLWMQWSYKLFYRLFDYFSYLSIPHDAGDFSLLDRKVVQGMLRFPERDLFLRGVRAFVGFKQTGVDYVRPERMFGHTTNSLTKNIAWAKKGILSFSNSLLTMLSFCGGALFLATIVLMLLQVASRVLFPRLSPPGITTTLLLIMFFGSVNLLGIGILAEYIARIFEEVKQRPLFIRRSIVKDGEVRKAAGDV